MVTARQIKELTAARLAGQAPSYPEQWLEKGWQRKQLKKGKQKKVQEDDEKLPKIREVNRSRLESIKPKLHAKVNEIKQEKVSAQDNSGSDSDLDSPRTAKVRFPLRPLRWPRTRDEQLQTICSIRRMLRQLAKYLQTNSTSLIDAMPRLSVDEEGLIKVSILHNWLCSLKTSNHQQEESNEIRSDTEEKPDFSHDQAPQIMSKEDPIPPTVARAFKTYFNVDQNGEASMTVILEAFRTAKRLALRREDDDPLVHSVPPQENEDDLESIDQNGIRQKNTTHLEKDEESSLVPTVRLHQLNTAYGPVTEAEIHDLVDVLFSDSEAPEGCALELRLQELEIHVRALRRLWAQDKDEILSEQQNSDTQSQWTYDKTLEERIGDVDPELDDGTWERLMRRISRILAALEDYLFVSEGMRFVELVKWHCCSYIDKRLSSAHKGMSSPAFGSSVLSEDIRPYSERQHKDFDDDHGATVSSELLRERLIHLFDAKNPEARARAAIHTAKKKEEARIRNEEIARDESISEREREMTRLGLGAILRRVERVLLRRGLRPRECLDLFLLSGNRSNEKEISPFLAIEDTDKHIPLEAFFGLMRSLLEKRTMEESTSRWRQLKTARDLEAKKIAADRVQKENDFVARMRIAEKCGVVSSFAKLDRHFRRYQLTAEGIWKMSHRDGSDFTAALGPREFHNLLTLANINLTIDQAVTIVEYLDIDGNGEVDFVELQDAISDYRRWKRVKRKLELRRAHAEQRLFLAEQVTLLLQYLVLISAPNTAATSKPNNSAILAIPATTNTKATLTYRHQASDQNNNDFIVPYTSNIIGQEEQHIFILDFQRALDNAGSLPVAEYFLEIRKRLYTETYARLGKDEDATPS